MKVNVTDVLNLVNAMARSVKGFTLMTPNIKYYTNTVPAGVCWDDGFILLDIKAIADLPTITSGLIACGFPDARIINKNGYSGVMFSVASAGNDIRAIMTAVTKQQKLMQQTAELNILTDAVDTLLDRMNTAHLGVLHRGMRPVMNQGMVLRYLRNHYQTNQK